MSVPTQLPAYSPVSIPGLVAGLSGLTLPSASSIERLAGRVRAEYDCRRFAGMDSGTSALATALTAAHQRLDRLPVALPAYGCYDLATAADTADVPIRLYDLDPVTLGPDWASLRSVMAEGVSAVVVAHLYGVPVDMDPVSELACETGSIVIEDAAQGFGASYGGRPLGSMGSYGVLSFGRGKGITGGGGGALLLNDAEAEASFTPVEGSRGRGLKELSAVAALWIFGRPATYRIPASMPFLGLGDTPYHAPSPIRTLSHASARLVEAIWDDSLREVDARRESARRLRQSPVILERVRNVEVPAGSAPGWLRLPVRATEGARDALTSDRARRLGIMPAYPRPLSELRGFGGRCVSSPASLDGAAELASTLFTLPTHSRLSAGAIEAIEELLAH